VVSVSTGIGSTRKIKQHNPRTE